MLWQNIQGFDLDYPLSEYGFSTRLETENCWTTNFARDAITEYKKFMYLATVSDSMVSPSEIVDIVWHQHLLFTDSYEKLSTILGKKIAHIPSTHNRSEYNRFKQAREHTEKLYREHFGEQPREYWDYPDIYGSLQIKKSRFKVENIVRSTLILIIPLLLIAYSLLRPVYITINNPFFVLGYIGITLFSLIFLDHYNFSKFNGFRNSWDKQSFMFRLSPFELIYLKQNKVKDVIHGVVNQLIRQDKLNVLKGHKLSVKDMTDIKSREELVVLETISEHGEIGYPDLLKHLLPKSIFTKTMYTMEKYKQEVSESAFFVKLFSINFITLSVVLLLGIVRIITGALRDKPIVFITLLVMLSFIVISIFLYRLKRYMGSSAIIHFYKECKPPKTEWEWEYFLRGSAVFVPVFMPFTTYVGDGSVGGGDGGSGCGSSCGSSCGGGCGGGCGGCGS